MSEGLRRVTPAAQSTDAISTTRLRLVVLPPPLLRAVTRGDLDDIAGQLDAPVGEGWEEGIPAAVRLDQLAADPGEQPWLVRAMIARSPRHIVGSAGFHAPPDDRGRVEIGFHVVAAERRRGYAREATLALLDWAAGTGLARTCVASVSPDNVASLNLIRSLGFLRTGEQIDERDGLEWVFERRLSPCHR
jgi:[ribosomal protein S5]-alanine N-acetyltransferase